MCTTRVFSYVSILQNARIFCCRLLSASRRRSDEIRDQLDECMQLLRFSDQSAERVDLLGQLIDHCRTIPRLAEYTARRTLLRTYVCEVEWVDGVDDDLRQLVFRVESVRPFLRQHIPYEHSPGIVYVYLFHTEYFMFVVGSPYYFFSLPVCACVSSTPTRACAAKCCD
jgi:hypothetical protein